MKNALYCCLTALALGFGMATTAQAAADHTWVSRSGVDSGTTCAVAAPCRTLAYAHNQTNAGGTISVLDSGDYSALIISKAITIKAAAGVDATITGTVAGPDNVSITAGASDVVVLEGLTIDGGANGIANGVVGVDFVSGAAVYVINCTIKNNTAAVYNTSSTPNARAFIQRSSLLRSRYGAYVVNSDINSTRVISILDSLIDGSSIAGVRAGNATIIGMARTVVNAGPAAIITNGTGEVISIGPSNVTSGSGAFTSTIPFN